MLKKVLYISASQNIIGGGEISLLLLIEKLDKKFFQPIVLCPGTGSFTEALKRKKIRVEVMEGGKFKDFFTLIRLPLYLYKLMRLMSKENIKIIHSNVTGGPTVLAGIAARILSIPFIWHVRVVTSAGFLDKIQAGLSLRIIVISEAVRKRFNWLGDRSKIYVVYNGIDLEKFNERENGAVIRKEFGIIDKDIIFGMVARLDPWKNYECFIEAAALVIKECPATKFLIVGKDFSESRRYEAELKKLAEGLGVGGNVIFCGERKDMPNIMAALDIFVLTSFNEPFGRVVVEAMAAGRAVIAADSGGIPEVVEDGKTGILFPFKDTRAAAKAMLRLARDKNLRELMGHRGRKRCGWLFSLKDHVENIERIYRDLVK